MNSKVKQLASLLEQLSEQHQQSVVDFAGYLVGQYHSGEADRELFEPRIIQRAPEETVVGAIKRLKQSYYMLDTDNLLNKTSALMGQHLLQGREAGEVIDQLETLFEASYEEYLKP